MSSVHDNDTAPSGNTGALFLSWAFVGIPLAWGVWLTLINAEKLFK